jgi:hypothetical protein
MKSKLLQTLKNSLFILTLLIASMNIASAQTPANDYCGTAVALSVYGATCGGTITGDVAGATQSVAPLSCGGTTSATAKDVWYKFVANSTSHIITVIGSASFDAVVELQDGACGNNLSCADATTSGGTETITATGLIVGTTYFLRVYSWGASVPATTTFTICVTTPPPANDDCSGAIALTVYNSTCGGATTGNDAGATQSIAAAPCTGTADDDVWYKFVATSALETITVVGSANFDAVVNLRSGSCSGTNVTCVDATNTGGTEVINATGLTIGSTYFVRVYHYWPTAPSTTTFTICVTAPAPANDDCAGATALTVYGSSCGGAVTGNVAAATQSLAAFCAGTANDDVWYKFVATGTAHDITVVGSTSLDPVVELRSGACNGSNLSCADATNAGGTEVIHATGLTVGSTYYVRVYDYGTSVPATTTFTICVTTPTPPTPVNDDCANATSLTVYGATCGGALTGNVTGATQSIAPITCGATSTTANDVWYKFVATATAHTITVVGSTSFDAVVDLRTGACTGTNVNCADITATGGTETLAATGLTIGNTYFVRVYHYGSSIPTTPTFTICVTTPAPPPPANDNCAGATSLTVYGATCGGATTGNVTGATQSLAATCAGTANDDVWYKFVATATTHIITVVGSTSFDPVVDLRTGTCNGTNLSCRDTSNAGGTEIMTATGLTVGTTYYVRVYDYGTGTPATATFTICVTTPAPPTPPNDSCANAISLTVYGATCGGATTGNVLGATQSLPALTCNSFSSTTANDVWYSFVATATSHNIKVIGSASFDAVVDLRSGACTGTNISCSDSTSNGGTEVIRATGLTIGTTYLIRVYSYGSSIPATTTFTICITTPTPVNDDCTGATPLTVYGVSCGGTVTGNVLGATQSLPGTCAGTANDDIWYSFVATSTSHIITVVGSASFDAVVDLRSGSCNGTNISCSDVSGTGGTETLTATGLTAGSTYYVRVYDYYSSVPATTTFTICVTTPAPPTPPNDDCSGAIPLTVYGPSCGGAVTGNVASATQSLPSLLCHGFTGTANDDVWYSFVATATAHNITVVGSANFDAVVDLRSGACNGSNIACADSTVLGGTEVIFATGLTIGSTYFVRVYDYGSGIPSTTTFTICVTTPAGPPPANDNCAGATALTVYGATCGGAVTGDVTGATQSIAALSCGGTTGNANDDVWYKFVATATSHDVTVVGSASFNAVIDLRTGACNGTNLNCADASGNGGTEVVHATGLTIGSTYFVRVYDYGTTVPATTTFTICVTTPTTTPPANDDCAGAIPLPVYGASCGGATTGNVTAATQSIPGITCNGLNGNADDDVWYKFVATATSHDITVVGSVGFNAVVDLRSGPCTGTTIDCADSTLIGGTEIIHATGLSVGSTYFVRIYDYGTGVPATTAFTICITTPTSSNPPPTNDNCTGAASLTVYGATCGGATTGDVANATQSLPALLCNGLTGTLANDVWYSFVATAASHAITVVGSASFDAVIDLRSGACSTGTNIDCANSTLVGGTEVITATGLTVGTTYYVRVYSFGSTVPATTTFTICVTTPSSTSAPANDDCAGATPLTVYGLTCGGATTGDVTGATQSLPAISCGSTGTADDDVWYSFVATATAHDVTVVGSTSFDAVIDLRSGACTGTNIDCADATATGGTEVVHATGLTIGSTYFVRVYDYGTGTPATSTFTICVTTPPPPPPPPANDDCTGAVVLTVYGTTCGGTVTGDVGGATQSLPAITCNGTGTANDDVWYSFVATATTHIITVVGSASFDAVVDLRSGACTGTNINCSDSSFSGGTEVVNATSLIVGNMYYVRVYDYSSSVPATTTFNICITTPCTPPNTIANPAAATVCSGNSTTLSVSGASSYTWSPSTGLSSSTGSTVTATPFATTTYTVTGTANNCTGTQVVTVTVAAPFTATITQQQNLLTSTPGTSYQWYLNGITIPGATSQSYLATEDGNYTVSVVGASGCTALSAPFPIISFLGVDGKNTTVTIYPNPFSTSATIEIKGATINGEVEMKVYDMVGREVKRGLLVPNAQTTTPSGMQFTIDRNDLSNGMYFYKLTNRNGIIGSGKFSIQ